MPMVQIENLDIVFGNQKLESLRLLDKMLTEKSRKQTYL